MSDSLSICLVCDQLGRNFVGTVKEEANGRIILSNPLLFMERIEQQRNGQARVMSGLEPMSHTYNDLDNIIINNYVTCTAVSGKLIEVYNQRLTQLRALRSGIVAAPSMPDLSKLNLKQ